MDTSLPPWLSEEVKIREFMEVSKFTRSQINRSKRACVSLLKCWNEETTSGLAPEDVEGKQGDLKKHRTQTTPGLEPEDVEGNQGDSKKRKIPSTVIRRGADRTAKTRRKFDK